MKKGFIVVLILVMFLFSCSTDRPEVKKRSLEGYINPSVELTHLVWIPIDKKGDLHNLFESINHWIEEHQHVNIIDVEVINATKRSQGYEGYTIPSGALIIFSKK